MSELNKIKSPFSLSNLDSDTLLNPLTEHQSLLVKIGVVVGALIIAGLLFNDHHIKDQLLQNKMTQVNEKLEAIKDRNTAVQAVVKFKSSLPPKISENDLIDLITNYVRTFHVNITALSPPQSGRSNLYDTLNVTINGESANFKNMMLFIRAVEGPKSPLEINSWSGREDENGKMSFTMQISVVEIRNNVTNAGKDTSVPEDDDQE
jgi:hypothetical protein